MTKVQGFCTCNSSSKSVDFDLIKREIILDDTDLIRWKTFNRGTGPLECRGNVLQLPLKKAKSGCELSGVGRPVGAEDLSPQLQGTEFGPRPNEPERRPQAPGEQVLTAAWWATAEDPSRLRPDFWPTEAMRW